MAPEVGRPDAGGDLGEGEVEDVGDFSEFFLRSNHFEVDGGKGGVWEGLMRTSR